MSNTSNILDQALELSPVERADIAQRLLYSLDTTTVVLPVNEYEEYKQLKLEKLQQQVLKGQEDYKNGRYTAISSQEELQQFFKDRKKR